MVTVARRLQAARATNAGGCSQMGCCFGCDRATLLREKPPIIPSCTRRKLPSGKSHPAVKASFQRMAPLACRQMAAAAATFSDSSPPGCAMRMRWAACTSSADETPCPSWPSTQAQGQGKAARCK